jgi:competence protein ComEA
VIPRSSRLALLCLALLLSAILLVKSRVPAPKGEGAAFFVPAPPGSITVRLAGDFPHPGLYPFPDGTSAETAIKLTLPGVSLTAADRAKAVRPLVSGDIVTLGLRVGQPAVLAMDRMATKERMLLGIALDPDLLEAEEWACLPGIGPVLAARIVADRHKNGGFGALERVARVPGIGPGKLQGIKRFF